MVVLDFESGVSGFELRVLNIEFEVLGFELGVLDFGLGVSVIEVSLPGFVSYESTVHLFN